MEKLTIVKKMGMNKMLDVVSIQQILDFFNRGLLKVVVPIEDKREREFNTKHITDSFKRQIERKIERSKEEKNDWDKYEHVSDDIPNVIDYIINNDYTDPVSGEIGKFVLELDTNEIVPYHWNTDEKLLKQERIFEEGETVEIDIPSGKMVFGYYSTFVVFEESDEISGDYFGSEIEKKSFFDYYSEKNAVIFYRGGWDLYKDNKTDNYIFGSEGYIIETEDEMPYEMVSRISHDKMSIFCDLDSFLKEAKEKNINITGIIDSEEVDIIDVEPGRYKFTLWNKYKSTKQNAQQEPEEKYRETLYTLYGTIEKIG